MDQIVQMYKKRKLFSLPSFGSQQFPDNFVVCVKKNTIEYLKFYFNPLYFEYLNINTLNSVCKDNLHNLSELELSFRQF